MSQSFNFEIVEAAKVENKLRFALDGPAGSGKTWTGLLIAYALQLAGQGSKVVVLDTERFSSAKYAKIFPKFNFDIIDLAKAKNFDPARYVAAIQFCESQGYDIIMIDSLSHAWAGTGGALSQVDDNSIKFSGNKYYAWRDVTPKHNALVDALLNSSAHIIATMRTKVEYSEQMKNGQKSYVKIGTAPIQREGLDYEFDIVMDMTIEHAGVITKSRCSAVDGLVYQPFELKHMDPIVEWIASGEKEVKTVAEGSVEVKEQERPKEQKDLIAYAKEKGAKGKVATFVAEALQSAGITGFDPNNWDAMTAAIDSKLG